MNLTLKRTDYLQSGIFGELEPEDESFTLFTLEHAYPETPDGVQSSTTYQPKIPQGTYNCVRGLHVLEGMTVKFETFEVTNVPGHTNILIHPGNWNKDSHGCILLGLVRQGNQAILQSREAFKEFMKSQEGNDNFTLTVI